MKKIFSAMLFVILLVGLVSCNDSVYEKKNSENENCTVTFDLTEYGDLSTVIFLDAAGTKPLQGGTYSVTVKKGEVCPTVTFYIEGDAHNATEFQWSDSASNSFDLTKPVSSNVTLFLTGGACIVSGSEITMGDGSKQFVENIGVGDELLTWDFYSGSLVKNKVVAYEKTSSVQKKKISITTDGGNTISFVDIQSFFDTDAKKYFSINLFNYKSAVGKNILVADGSSVKSEKITNVTAEDVEVDVFDVITEYAFNFFADNVLTVYPGILAVTPYDVDSSYKFDAEKMNQDQQKYGLYTYDEFKQYGTKEAFDMFRFAEIKVLVGKKLVSREFVEYAINNFFEVTENSL